MKKIYLICSLFLFGCSNSEATDPLEDLTSSKWSIGDFPCDLKGGLYVEYGEDYPAGVSLTTNGKKTSTGQKTWQEFVLNKDGSITFNSKIFAGGNNVMTQFTGSPETPVFIEKSKIKIEGNKLYIKGTRKDINVDILLSEKRTVYKEKNFDNIKNRCEPF